LLRVCHLVSTAGAQQQYGGKGSLDHASAHMMTPRCAGESTNSRFGVPSADLLAPIGH
jgi:hypothetical protein